MKPRAVRIILLVLLALEIALLVFGPRTGDHLPNIYSAIDAGKRPDWWDDAAMGVRYAAWINAGLIAVLLATSKFWTRPFQNSQVPDSKSEIRNPKWFRPSLIIAAALCLGLRLPLASKSLWWDEAWVIMQASHGKWTPDKKHEGQMKFLAHDWKRCAWYYQKPTNHAPMSLLQKLSIGTWQKITGAKRSDFSDLAARVPALAASCIAVVLLGLLLRAWGRPGAGIASAFVLAIHPWHIRYGVDARAYALVVPLCISGMFAVTRLGDSGGRRPVFFVWWGLTELLWLWAFPNAVFDIAALNIVAAMLLWKAHAGDNRDRGTAILRLATMNAFAAICFIQMFLPSLMQARRWAGREADAHVLDFDLASNTVSQLLLGRDRWFPPVDGGPGSMGPVGNPLVLLFIFWCLFFSLCVRMKKRVTRIRQRSATWMLTALAVSAVVFSGLTWLLHSYFYPRFVIALLPVCIAAVSIVLVETKWSRTALPVTVLGFVASSIGPVELLVQHPIAPLRDIASFAQSIAGADGSRPLLTCYGLGREVMPVYAPTCMPLEKRDDLETIMQRAKSEKRDLFVTYGYDSFNRSMLPTGFALLDDRSLFEEVKSFPGIEPEFFFRVLRMK